MSQAVLLLLHFTCVAPLYGLFIYQQVS